MATAVVKERMMVAWIKKWMVLINLQDGIGFCNCLNVKGDAGEEGGIKDDPRFHIPVMGWKVISLLEIMNIGGRAYWSGGVVLRSLYLDPETGLGRCLEGSWTQ